MKAKACYWISTNRGHHRWHPALARRLAGSLRWLSRRVERLSSAAWYRYRADLARVPPAPDQVTLRPVTEGIIARLRQHPDAQCNQLRSGFRFWEHGLRRAFIWLDGDEPVCIQWLLLPNDAPLLARLPEWSGMYPPLPAATGQVENLFKFTSPVRRRQVAVNFELAVFEQARRLGLQHVITHIHVDNDAANRFAFGAAFEPAGIIQRYRVNAAGLRGWPLCIHEMTEQTAEERLLDLRAAA